MSYYEPYNPDISEKPFRDLYFFLRTNTALDLADEAIDALSEQCPFDFFELFQFDVEGSTWIDGFVLKGRAQETPYEMARACAGALEKFASWAIYVPGEEAVEFPSGLIAHFFDKRNEWEIGRNVDLIFLMSSSATDSTNSVGKIIEELNDDYYGRRCATVFRFRDGEILFAITGDPSRTTSQRVARHTRHLGGWAFVGEMGVLLSTGGEHPEMWTETSLEDLAFGNDSDEA